MYVGFKKRKKGRILYCKIFEYVVDVKFSSLIYKSHNINLSLIDI